MMLVRCFVAPSAIEGLGTFTRDPISKGTEIYRFTPPFDTVLDTGAIDDAPPSAREFLARYTFTDPANPEKMMLEFDEGRYMNHSDDPNTDCSGIYFGFAVRDIAAGEELTCHYGHLEGGKVIIDPPRWVKSA
ncbi:MAG: SET domain-containing protein-lysine N-methyltransferase [Rhodospirillaceae bacterium]